MEEPILLDINEVAVTIQRGRATAWKFVSDAKLKRYRKGDSQGHFFRKADVVTAWNKRQSRVVAAMPRKKTQRGRSAFPVKTDILANPQ